MVSAMLNRRRGRVPSVLVAASVLISDFVHRGVPRVMRPSGIERSRPMLKSAAAWHVGRKPDAVKSETADQPLRARAFAERVFFAPPAGDGMDFFSGAALRDRAFSSAPPCPVEPKPPAPRSVSGDLHHLDELCARDRRYDQLRDALAAAISNGACPRLTSMTRTSPR